MNTCKIKQVPARLTWTEMHQKNAWIYSTPESRTVNINCDFNTGPIILQGSGLLKLPARCIIHDQDITIVGRQTMISRLNSSFLPSFNLSEMLVSQNFKSEEQSIITSSSSLDLTTLERSIQIQRDHEHLLKEIKTHRTYQHSLLGVTGCLITIVVLAVVIFTIRRRTSHSSINSSSTKGQQLTTSSTPIPSERTKSRPSYKVEVC